LVRGVATAPPPPQVPPLGGRGSGAADDGAVIVASTSYSSFFDPSLIICFVLPKILSTSPGTFFTDLILKVEDCTLFEDDEYLINVAKDVVPIKTNAAMWITSDSGVCNESDSLMLFTMGTSKQRKNNYVECSTPIQIVQGGGGNNNKMQWSTG
jgi:hypothetical protein